MVHDNNSRAATDSASWLSSTIARRECLAAVADVSLSGRRVARELDFLIATRGGPKTIVSDNGTELISNAILFWADQTPGNPLQNTFVESFNGHLQNEFLTRRCLRPCRRPALHSKTGDAATTIFRRTLSTAGLRQPSTRPNSYRSGIKAPRSTTAPRVGQLPRPCIMNRPVSPRHWMKGATSTSPEQAERSGSR